MRSIAIAPEKKNAVKAVALLRSSGVRVSIGHSSADALKVQSALAAGANTVVHLYNGMAPLHHRDPGLLGTALVRDCYTELICDGYHVKDLPIQIAARCKPSTRMILITDCMRAGGLPDGEYRLGEEDVRVEGGAAYLKKGESLAGSTLSLDRAVANYRELGHISLEDAVLAATQNPAAALGILEQTGTLTPGKRADIIAIDGRGCVRFVSMDSKVKVDRI